MALDRRDFLPQYLGVFDAFAALKAAAATQKTEAKNFPSWQALVGAWGVFGPKCSRTPSRGEIQQFASRVSDLIAATATDGEFQRAVTGPAQSLSAAVASLLT